MGAGFNLSSPRSSWALTLGCEGRGCLASPSCSRVLSCPSRKGACPLLKGGHMDTPVPPQLLGAHFILRERGRQALEITAGLGLLAPTWNRPFWKGLPEG